ncbi:MULTISPECIES: holo-ACP synthase [Terrisporobacter]|uniref:Holo-[acyl-carrier-protein] synthase n=1 Tax=Terrisporobacter hibernicus TaxID=2813371 RepID=A0AAX2ZJU3_9FIRM|nr:MULTISPECIES: holo-ACP synthase [Terrisporobacter]UEL49106.1 holo-ACP synthase [Terrisporobacter hibernicus]SFJ50515.1 holo-[acyl-carrier protein] synthase [Terrisporobacter glycolicus]
MNILDIGIDIIEIERIKKALVKRETFLKKLFTDKEIELFESKGYRAETIAGNFAAKEAISKSLGLGIRGYNLKDIEVLRDELGKPIVKTHNNLEQICKNHDVLEIKVSISHGKDYAIANAMTIIREK